MFEDLQSGLEKTLKVLKGQAKIRPEHIDEALKEIRTSLLEADVQYAVVNRFLERVKEEAVGKKVADSLTPYQQFIKIISKEMLDIFGPAKELDLAHKPPVVLLMVGLQGSGKTTSSAKLALYAKKKLKRKPLLVSVDVTRPAAIEQLERLAADAKIDYFKTTSVSPVKRAEEAVKYAQTYGLDFLIVDTAGRLSIDEPLMKELAEIQSAVKPQHLLYVADAMSGQQGLQVAEGFSARVGLTGAVLSKTDGDARGGVAFSIREALKVPLQFVGTGEKLDGFEPFYPDRWVSRILGLGDVLTLIEKAEEVAKDQDESKMKDQAKRMMKGQLTLRDFQEQMKMISKMGSLGGMMGMIPGMGNLVGKIDQEAIAQRMKRIDAMINSMTPAEREDPDLLNGGRKRRVTAGSGTKVEDLNQFLREFQEMQKLMKRFSGKGAMRGMAGLMGGGNPFGR